MSLAYAASRMCPTVGSSEIGLAHHPPCRRCYWVAVAGVQGHILATARAATREDALRKARIAALERRTP